MEEGIKGREAGVRKEEGEEVTASEMVSGEGKKEGKRLMCSAGITV